MIKDSFSIKFISSLLIIGAGIGWLIGLSVSPVVSIVITSVTGAAAAIVAAMSGLENQPNTSGKDETKSHNFRAKINPFPMALLVFGIITGSIIGIIARNQDWFGSQEQSALSSEINQWTAMGLPQEEVVRRLFENQYTHRGWHGADLSAEVEKWKNVGVESESVALRLFENTYPLDYGPTSNIEKSNGAENKDPGTVLFSIGSTECDNLYKAMIRSQEALVEELQDVESLKDLPNIVDDPQTLEKIVTEVLCP